MSMYLWRYILFCFAIFGLFKGSTFLVDAFSNSHKKSESSGLEVALPLQSAKALDIIVVSTLDGLLRGISRSTGEVLWALDSVSEALVKVGVSSTPQPTEQESIYRYVRPSKVAKNTELVRVDSKEREGEVMYIPELLGEGNVYVLQAPEPLGEGIKSSKDLQKLPFSIKEMVEKSPYISGNTMYVGSKSTKYYAIDLITGQLLQTFGDSITGECAELSVLSPGVLFLGKAEYKLSLYNRTKGKYEWDIVYSEILGDTFEQIEPIISTDNAQIFTGLDGGILSYNPAEDQTNWANKFGSPVISTFDVLLDTNRRTIAIKQPPPLRNFESGAKYVGKYNGMHYALPPEQFRLTIGQYSDTLKYIEYPDAEYNKTLRGKLWEYTKRRGPFIGLTVLVLYILWYFKLATLQAWYRCKDIFIQLKHYLKDKSDEMYGMVFTKLGYSQVVNSEKQHSSDSAEAPRTPKSKKKKKGGKGNKASLENQVVLPEPVKPVPQVVERIKGTLQLNTLSVSDTVLGYGSHGTIVYKGSFDGRDVAVKRLLIDFYDIADHEVSLLRESDDHPNVIRYYCKERCDRFMYIAVELCQASLFDSIEKGQLSEAASLIASVPPSKILYQIISGIHHLHSLKIIHRDIKPQNILVSAPKQFHGRQNLPRILISDFGLCKRLEGEQSSFNNTTNSPAGTIGWRAPECLSSDVVTSFELDESESSSSSPLVDSSLPPRPTRITRAIDIFSAGCVFYYVLSGGEHPFGDRFVRESNILRGRYSLSKIDEMVEEGVEAKDLIARMIAMEPRQRPSAYAVMLHPYFWTPAKRLAFLQDVSDRFEVEERDPPSALLQVLEDNAEDVVGEDWYERIDRILIDNLGRYRRYDGYRIQDLLRAMRNKKHHYQDLPDNVKRSLGPLPHGFLAYFTSRFPNLFLHVYYTIANDSGLRQEHIFQPYFMAPNEL